ESQVREAVITQRASQLAAAKAKEVADRLRAPADMATLAKAMKLDVTDSIDFGRTDSVEGLGPAGLIEDAFKKPVGTIVGPVSVQGREVVYQIVDQKAVDPSKLTRERAAVLADLKRKKGAMSNALF